MNTAINLSSAPRVSTAPYCKGRRFEPGAERSTDILCLLRVQTTKVFINQFLSGLVTLSTKTPQT